MRVVDVSTGGGAYAVKVGAGVLSDASLFSLASGAKAAVMADANVPAVHCDALRASLAANASDVFWLEVGAGEGCKSWDRVISACDFLAKCRLGRGDLVVAVGGGAVCDIAGFVASIYLRGIAGVLCPTTLLAQVDASVGGKTGINIGAGKNLVGSFHQPRLVVADVGTLSDLPGRAFRAGLAEVVKHAVLDEGLFHMLAGCREELGRGPAADPGLLAEVVEANVRIKASIVAMDERESGVRAHLNLGHTFAHALETAMGHGNIEHGEAVAIGLVAACDLSGRLGLADATLQGEVEAMLATLGLPVRFPPFDMDSFRAALALDKKARRGRLRFVVPLRLGKVEVRDDVPADLVEKTLAGLMEKEHAH